MASPGLLLALLLLFTSACQRQPYYPPPEQRQPPGEETAAIRASTMINMNDEDAPEHLVQDISPTVEGGSWRWVKKRPTVKVLLVKTRGLKLSADFTLWEGAMRQTGPVTMSYFIDNKLLDKVRYDTAGYKHFEKPVDFEWLQTAADTTVAMEIDKLYVDPADHTQLGFILTKLGFERQ